jgi:hypothetical protein
LICGISVDIPNVAPRYYSGEGLVGLPAGGVHVDQARLKEIVINTTIEFCLSPSCRIAHSRDNNAVFQGYDNHASEPGHMRARDESEEANGIDGKPPLVKIRSRGVGNEMLEV